MTRDEIERAVRDHAARLEQLARMIEHSFWPATTGVRFSDVRAYLERVIAHMVGADGVHALNESTLLQALAGRSATWEEASASATDTVDRHPDAPWMVPAFVRAARLQDAASGTRILSAIAGEVDSLCAVVALADGHVGDAETELIATIRATITQA